MIKVKEYPNLLIINLKFEDSHEIIKKYSGLHKFKSISFCESEQVLNQNFLNFALNYCKKWNACIFICEPDPILYERTVNYLDNQNGKE